MSTQTEKPMVYNHDADDYKEAIDITAEETNLIALKLSKITSTFVENQLTISQMTELIDVTLSRKELLYTATMHVKSVCKDFMD